MENCEAITCATMDAVRLLATKDPDVEDYTRTAASMRQAMEVCRMRAEAKRVEAEELVYDYSQEVQP